MMKKLLGKCLHTCHKFCKMSSKTTNSFGGGPVVDVELVTLEELDDDVTDEVDVTPVVLPNNKVE